MIHDLDVRERYRELAAQIYYSLESTDDFYIEGYLAGLEEAAVIAGNKSELRGVMAKTVRSAFLSLSREKQLRVVLRATKKSITQRIRQRAAELKKEPTP